MSYTLWRNGVEIGHTIGDPVVDGEGGIRADLVLTGELRVDGGFRQTTPPKGFGEAVDQHRFPLIRPNTLRGRETAEEARRGLWDMVPWVAKAADIIEVRGPDGSPVRHTFLTISDPNALMASILEAAGDEARFVNRVPVRPLSLSISPYLGAE